ncbi:hypothetical protein FH972_023915 [Carpinus fangiana]|uniref:Flavanone 4-reductase n=1 Tax=Carpinus fangiana TaxID=176857 RepID=A0A5N6KWX4_9ROSI|nr:hypothetical protein FH972_023915 [Carpinus fangiana]
MASSDLVLLTGSTGHVGFRSLVTALKAGYRVRAAVRNPKSVKVDKIKASPEIAALNLAPDTLTFVTVPDFLAPGAFDAAAQGVKYIVHIASPIPEGQATDGGFEKLFIEPAVRGTLAVLEAAEKAGTVEKIVVTSSVASILPPSVLGGDDKSIYDANNRVATPPGPFEDSFPAYVASKIAALNEAEAWYKKHTPKFSLIHIHPGVILGPDALVNDIDELLAGGTNPWLIGAATGSPEPRLAGTVHVNDVAKVHIDALQPQIKGLQSFGASISTNWRELEGIVAKDFPEAVKNGTFKIHPDFQVKPINIDSSATEKAFGFKFITFEEQAKDVLQTYLTISSKA